MGYGLERGFLVLEFRKTHFPGLSCLRKEDTKIAIFFYKNHGLTSLE